MSAPVAGVHSDPRTMADEMAGHRGMREGASLIIAPPNGAPAHDAGVADHSADPTQLADGRGAHVLKLERSPCSDRLKDHSGVRVRLVLIGPLTRGDVHGVTPVLARFACDSRAKRKFVSSPSCTSAVAIERPTGLSRRPASVSRTSDDRSHRGRPDYRTSAPQALGVTPPIIRCS